MTNRKSKHSISRRETLRLMGAAGATALVGWAGAPALRLLPSGKVEAAPQTSNDDTNPTTVLIARKTGKKIGAGETVTLQVRNSDNTLSSEYAFTRPVE
jgi:hypothetical protein